MEFRISGKSEENKLYFRRVSYKAENDDHVIIKNSSSVIPLQEKIKYGESYEFYIVTTGCSNTCTEESNITTRELRRTNFFY